MEANASKREQRVLAHYAEREHFRASEAWSIENGKLVVSGQPTTSQKSQKSQKSQWAQLVGWGF